MKVCTRSFIILGTARHPVLQCEQPSYEGMYTELHYLGTGHTNPTFTEQQTTFPRLRSAFLDTAQLRVVKRIQQSVHF